MRTSTLVVLSLIVTARRILRSVVTRPVAVDAYARASLEDVMTRTTIVRVVVALEVSVEVIAMIAIISVAALREIATISVAALREIVEAVRILEESAVISSVLILIPTMRTKTPQ